jgi:hypothetical protein
MNYLESRASSPKMSTWVMPMSQEKIKASAIIELHRLRSELPNPLDVLTVINIMKEQRLDVEQGVLSDYAAKALLKVWRQLDLINVDHESLSHRDAAVEKMHELHMSLLNRVQQ